MKKALSLLVVLAMMAGAFAGCGGEITIEEGDIPTDDGANIGEAVAAGDDDVLVIGYASNANDENQNTIMETFRQFCDEWNAAGNTPRLEYAITVADASVEKQLSDVESLIQRGCSAICIQSVDLEGLKPAVDACNAAGVLVLEARGMDYEGVDVNYRGSDEWMMAEMAFTWYKERMDADPELVLKMGLIYGLPSQTMQLIRVDRLVELLQEEYGEERVQVVATLPCDWDSQRAMECMENWYQMYGNEGMNCVVAAGAMMAMGAAQALVAVGEDMDDWIITTTDATSDVLYGIHNGVADMTVGIRAELHGPAIANLLVQMGLGEYHESEYRIGPEILATIDATNIDEWYTG